MASFVLPLGTSGVSKGDLGLRLYLNGSQVADPGITVAETASPGRYLVDSLPEGAAGNYYTLTWSYAGISGSYVYPNYSGAGPTNVVIPNRTTGLGSGDLNLQLFKNGSPNAASLTVTELVGGGGDYLVSGWPDEDGAWVLAWSYSGFHWSTGWVNAADADSDPLGWIEEDESDVSSLFLSWSECPVAWPRRPFEEPEHTTAPATPASFVEFRVLYDQVDHASFGDEWPMRRGRIEVKFWIQPGAGTALRRSLRTAAATLFSVGDTDTMTFFAPRPFEEGEARRQRTWVVEGLWFPFAAT